MAANSKPKQGLWQKLMVLGAKTGCHQDAARSFFFQKYQLPICARCTGILLGNIAGVIFCLFASPFWLSAFFVLPVIIDGLTQYLGWRVSNNTLRVATGLIAGFGNAVFWVWLLIALFC